jgi:hypothetical protein
MHIEIHSGIVPGEVYIIFCEDFLFDGDGVEDESEVRVALKVANVTHEKSPGNLSGEFIEREVDLLKRGV